MAFFWLMHCRPGPGNLGKGFYLIDVEAFTNATLADWVNKKASFAGGGSVFPRFVRQE
jgi:hypothetical protein